MDIITRTQLNILIQLAEVDKHFASAEREMIFELAKENNFPEDEVRFLIRNPEPIESLGALSPDQRLDYLLSVVELILIDKKVFDAEINFSKKIAVKLGFHADVIDFLLADYQIKDREFVKSQVLEKYL